MFNMCENYKADVAYMRAFEVRIMYSFLGLLRRIKKTLVLEKNTSVIITLIVSKVFTH